jgi:carbamoyl-phosphate synthase large subunit
MPKRKDIKKIMVIGSGPIVIGQAAEFDYAGAQACMALKEEGYEVVLLNSNPATIMTDTHMADKVYMEPLTPEYAARIIRRERPDALLPGIGGQTGLNLAMDLLKSGVLHACGTELLGTGAESIERAEDRELFRRFCESIGEPVLPSETVYNMEEAVEAARRIGYPVILRLAFTLGGTGGGFAENEEELREMIGNALSMSPVGQVLIEKSVRGWKEIEFEVIRDHTDAAITVCDMENIDPVGIHTGDSIVVAPSQTLSKKELAMLRDSALKVIRGLKIAGGCNVQFALSPETPEYYLIEVNPRVSRSSALASKASGYPIARVTAKIAVGMNLDEIMIADGCSAHINPGLEYVVTKMSRFPFDKFTDASRQLGTQMKATGEVMSIGKTMAESLLKAIRSLETGACHIHMKKFDYWNEDALLEYVKEGTDDRIHAIAQLCRLGTPAEVISGVTKIDKYFIDVIRKITILEKEIAARPFDREALLSAKRSGFSDRFIAMLWESTEQAVYDYRLNSGIKPVYLKTDGCAREGSGSIPCYYSTYNDKGSHSYHSGRKIVVLGSGPIRIGQGVEFDYSTVHAVKTIQEMGYEAIIINNNPETVSTDPTVGNKLYFEPLTVENVMDIYEHEKPLGIVATLGGQTAINLAAELERRGIKLIGTGIKAIETAENRDSFEKILRSLSIPQPRGEAVTSIEEGVRVASEIGYPVLVRPSYVLGGRAMQIVNNESALRMYLKSAVEMSDDQPVLVDKYIQGYELEVDAVCDGMDVFVPGIMQHIERTGIHSGDSISVYPPFGISDRAKGRILEYTKKLGIGLGITGLFNVQFVVSPEGEVSVIEVNPRSSRTVPFISKATGYPIADIATYCMLGRSLKEQGIFVLYPEEKKRCYVKAPAFSFSKLRGMDTYLSPEMKSTGEAIGYDDRLNRAIYKALQASGVPILDSGTLLATIADADKEEALPLIKRFYDMGFNIEATHGTAAYLKEHGIRTRPRAKISAGSNEILDSISRGHMTYIINTRDINSLSNETDGQKIRRCAAQNNVPIFTSLDTVKALLDVLEEMTMKVSTINE